MDAQIRPGQLWDCTSRKHITRTVVVVRVGEFNVRVIYLSSRRGQSGKRVDIPIDAFLATYVKR